MTWLERDRSRGESKCHRAEESCEEDTPVVRYVQVIALRFVWRYGGIQCEFGVEAMCNLAAKILENVAPSSVSLSLHRAKYLSIS